MPNVAKENPGLWVVVYTAGQSTPSGDFTQRPRSNRETIMSLCTILYTDSYSHQPVQSHYISGWANWICPSFKKMKESSIKKSIYVVWLHLIIIHDVNSLKVWQCRAPQSPFPSLHPSSPSYHLCPTKPHCPFCKMEKITSTS